MDRRRVPWPPITPANLLISCHETAIDGPGSEMRFPLPRISMGEEVIMEFRRLGASGLRVPALSFGTGTFGGKGDFFAAWGSTDAGGATRLVSVCLDHGVTMFDSADVYSDGASE